MSLLIIHMICNEKYIRIDAIIITWALGSEEVVRILQVSPNITTTKSVDFRILSFVVTV